MYVHIDGARIANATTALNVDLAEITSKIGIDALSFGLSKNGGMIGEAVVIFNTNLAKDFKLIRKQLTQLPAKCRFISAQFLAMLENNLWLNSSKHANDMAQYFATEITKLPGIELTQPVETNTIFINMPKHAIDLMLKKYLFYVWNSKMNTIRLMTSFATTIMEIDNFVMDLSKLI